MNEKKKKERQPVRHLTAIVNTCLVAAVILSVVILWAHGRSEASREIYNHSAEKAASAYGRFDESVQALAAGEPVEFEQLAGQYANLYLTFHQWGEVFPKYAEKGKLPYDTEENEELAGTETMVDLNLELRQLYYDTVNTYLIETSTPDSRVTQEAIETAGRELGEKIAAVCTPME
ncbi:MAG: hypothetical protein IJ443_03365 [Firmicutes bacterium]|nr:hypothetical protein [Bacillota bacterium]